MVGTRRTGAQDLHRQPKHPRQQSEQTIPGQHENQNRVLVAVERLSARLTRLKEQRGGAEDVSPWPPKQKSLDRGCRITLVSPQSLVKGNSILLTLCCCCCRSCRGDGWRANVHLHQPQLLWLRIRGQWERWHHLQRLQVAGEWKPSACLDMGGGLPGMAAPWPVAKCWRGGRAYLC